MNTGHPSSEMLSVFNAQESRLERGLPSSHLPSLDIDQELEKLAYFVAQAWKDDHPTACSSLIADIQACTLYVTTELAQAATAVGGPVGLQILTGGGSAAACSACQQVLSVNETDAPLCRES